jgi:hypothetical protein
MAVNTRIRITGRNFKSCPPQADRPTTEKAGISQNP